MLRLVLAFACLTFAVASNAQGPTDQQAGRSTQSDFESRWVSYGTDWWTYYEIPTNPYSPVLGQQGPIRRYVQVRQVNRHTEPRPLTQADRLNGLEWAGRVTYSATVAREYDVARGWGQWTNTPMLTRYEVELRNGRWQIVSAVSGFAVPANTIFRRPSPSELPAADAGPRSPPQGTDAPRAPVCAHTCRPGDGYCNAIRQKLLAEGLCFQDAATSQRLSRMSDAGYYYCAQKRQSGMSQEAALQQFQRLKTPRSESERALDRFAIDAARQSLCP